MLSAPPTLACTVTVVLCVAGVVPEAPSQVSVKVVVELSGPVLALPLVGSPPDQPPDAVQLLALLDVQLSVAEEPLLTVEASALNETAGLEDVGTPCGAADGPCTDAAPPHPLVSVAISG